MPKITIPTPTTVKIIVPMPPVTGRTVPLVFITLTVELVF